MKAIGVTHCAALVVMLALSGCAATQNTLAQDLAWERWEKCKAIDGISLQRIETHGRIWVLYSPDHTGALQKWRDCDRAAAAEQGRGRSAATPPPPGVASQAPSLISASAPAAPLWKIGDEWAYRYEGPSGSGTFVWTVDRVDRIEGVEYFVIKSGTRDLFYRVSDYAASHETVSGALVVKNTPPRLNLGWPLTVGKTWEQTIEEDRPQERQTTKRTWAWEVVKAETVTVQAGTFHAFLVVARNKGTGNPIFEMWLSPEVKQFVKIKEWLAAGGVRERELIAVRLK